MEQTFMKLNLTVLQFAGLWNPYSKGTIKFRINQFYSYTVCFLLTIHLSTQFANLFISTDNLEMMLDGFSLTLTFLSMYLKAFCLIVNHKTLKNITVKLTSGLLDPLVNYTEEEKKILKTCDNKGRIIAVINYILGAVVIIILLIFWFISNIGYITEFRENENVTTYFWKRELLYVTKYPCDPKNDTLCYLLTVIVQVSAATNGPSLNIGIDCIVASIMIHFCGHIKILKNTLKELDQITNSTLYKRESSFTGNKNYSKVEKFQNKVEGFHVVSRHSATTKVKYFIEVVHLRRCIYHHQVILKLYEDITHVLSPLLFCEFFLGSSTISLSIFQIIHITNKKVVYIQLVIVLLLLLMLYCWFGQEMIQESSEVAQAVFETSWFNKSKQFQESAMMMITRAQKACKVNGAHIYTVNLELFTGIISTSYSLYTLLSKLQS